MNKDEKTSNFNEMSDENGLEVSLKRERDEHDSDTQEKGKKQKNAL